MASAEGKSLGEAIAQSSDVYFASPGSDGIQNAVTAMTNGMMMPGMAGMASMMSLGALSSQRLPMQGAELPSMEEEPLYVNAKQYNRILKRRQARARLEAEGRIPKQRRPYMHESRHRHACNRVRGDGGRFRNKPGESGENPTSTSPTLQEELQTLTTAAAAQGQEKSKNGAAQPSLGLGLDKVSQVASNRIDVDSLLPSTQELNAQMRAVVSGSSITDSLNQDHSTEHLGQNTNHILLGTSHAL